MLHTKYQSSMPSSFREENFEVGKLCSYVDSAGRSQFLSQGYHMNKLGRGPQGDATYKISKLYAFQFQRKRILKFDVFVSTFKFVTPRAGLVLTPQASNVQTWYRSTRRCYIQWKSIRTKLVRMLNSL